MSHFHLLLVFYNYAEAVFRRSKTVQKTLSPKKQDFFPISASKSGKMFPPFRIDPFSLLCVKSTHSELYKLTLNYPLRSHTYSMATHTK